MLTVETFEDVMASTVGCFRTSKCDIVLDFEEVIDFARVEAVGDIYLLY